MKYIKLFEQRFEYYFTEEDVIGSEINIIETTENIEDGIPVLTIIVDELPSIPYGINTAHSSLENILEFLAMYYWLKDDELSTILGEVGIDHDIVIKTTDDRIRYRLGVSDLHDYIRKHKDRLSSY